MPGTHKEIIKYLAKWSQIFFRCSGVFFKLQNHGVRGGLKRPLVNSSNHVSLASDQHDNLSCVEVKPISPQLLQFGPSSPCDHTNKPNSLSSRQLSGELGQVYGSLLKGGLSFPCSGQYLLSLQTLPKGNDFEFLHSHHPYAHSSPIILHFYLLTKI